MAAKQQDPGFRKKEATKMVKKRDGDGDRDGDSDRDRDG